MNLVVIQEHCVFASINVNIIIDRDTFMCIIIIIKSLYVQFLIVEYSRLNLDLINDPPHDKTNNVVVRHAKTQISLGIRPVWSESSLSAWRNLRPLAIHWAHSEDSDQTRRMPRLIWVFAGRTVILLLLSWGSSDFNNLLSDTWQTEDKSKLNWIPLYLWHLSWFCFTFTEKWKESY